MRNVFGRLKNHIEILLKIGKEKRIVKWSQNENTSENIGDVLCSTLFEKTFEKEAINIKDVINVGFPKVYTFGGSVLDNSKVRNLNVIGSGFKRENSLMPVKPKKVISCRGPLTRKKLLDLGVDAPQIYGDPAILCPLFFDPIEVEKKCKMGLIPHYIDQELPVVKELCKNKDIKFIDIFSDFEDFVKQIKASEFTVSSSLHGVIISHAYGIPSVWVDLSKNIAGGHFKFHDYYASVSINNIMAIEDLGQPNFEELKKKATLPDLKILRENLISHLKNNVV
ncbi:polysaccharide pyruvyl transferase family protein [Pontixanthobacter gangjinensis]|uniref:Polysaccharide pyruvyl transferase family protein n=1 Tax=Christiangramia aestuarii TaxID=1028746 RepID=A0A7M3SWT2_9FLAO|nr:polysaccharide pyruvyl transferase family protein [Christiangramia aestuarii]MUP41063.1 polysaccharide pyruvyl transferase family protein [Christiangramia aestuarii]